MLQDLYDSEINVKIGWFWDGGIEVHLGNGIYDVYDNETSTISNHEAWDAVTHVKNMDEAEEWLKDKAIELYPSSAFAEKYNKQYELPGQDETHEGLDGLKIK